MANTSHATSPSDAQTASAEHSHPNLMTLYVTFGLLLILLVATVISAKHLEGRVATVTGLSISVVKTLLIVVIFMNLRGSVALIRLAAMAAILWLTIAIMFVMGDYATRGWDEANAANIQQATTPVGISETEAP